MDSEASRTGRQVTCPTAKLVDGNNLERAPLMFQCAAVEAENARVNVMQLMPVSESHGNASLPTGTLPRSDSHPPASPSLVSSCQTSSVWKSSLETGKRPGPDWTLTDQDRNF